jgi:septal ring factor EnvC (AmiA/AmiB activator)
MPMPPTADLRKRLFDNLAVSIAVVLLLLSTSSSFAQNTRDLKKVEGEIARDRQRQSSLETRSKKIVNQLNGLRKQMIQVARAVQQQEAHMTKLEEKLNTLNTEADHRRAALQKRHRQMQGTLAAMERLARNPPEALLLAPGRPIQVIRSATLLRAAVPQIQSRARWLQEEIAALGRIQADILAQYEQLKATTRALETERRNMETLAIRKASLRQITDVEKQRISAKVAQLTARARNLRDLFGELGSGPSPRGKTKRKRKTAAHGPRGPGSVRTFPKRGGVNLPARGRFVKTYGQNTGHGNTAKGITIAARPGAQVVAPFDGKVAFAGPFRGYGQILIIEHRGGYHTLLAGLESVASTIGQWLLAGEPVGVMAKNTAQKPQLYMELRRNGQPVNPLPWIAQDSGRRRG